jgi:Ala-tRNA(Pro) deacylase
LTISETKTVYDRLVDFLNEKQVPFSVLHHEPVFTSEDSARVRGTTLASGAKALVCKCDDDFVLIVLPADRKLSSKKVRQSLNIRSLRFASTEEVLELTGLRPGSIPPFGSLFKIVTYCDRGLRDQPGINFNAGDHAISISMASSDYEQAEQPIVGDFTDESNK